MKAKGTKYKDWKDAGITRNLSCGNRNGTFFGTSCVTGSLCWSSQEVTFVLISGQTFTRRHWPIRLSAIHYRDIEIKGTTYIWLSQYVEWINRVFRDKKIVPICKILQITKMIFFFHLIENSQSKVTVHSPHHSHMVEFLRILLSIFFKMRNSICEVCKNFLSRKPQLPSISVHKDQKLVWIECYSDGHTTQQCV